jgi:hypothetical protein
MEGSLPFHPQFCGISPPDCGKKFYPFPVSALRQKGVCGIILKIREALFSAQI